MDALTPTMSDCLKYARDHGPLRRLRKKWETEFWCAEGRPVPRFHSSTLLGLVNRGLMEWTEWDEGRRFPVVVRVREG